MHTLIQFWINSFLFLIFMEKKAQGPKSNDICLFQFKSLTYVSSSRKNDEVKLSSQLEDLHRNKNYDQNKRFI